MPDTDSALSIDSVANDILEILGDDDDGLPHTELAGDIDDLDDVLGKVAPSDDDDAAEPDAGAEADAPIQPPASWKADAKERFRSLPRELQQTIADREREREVHFSKTQQDATQVRKALEAEHQVVQQERHANVHTMSLLSEAYQTLDPVLAEGARTDWAKLSRENPAAAQAKWAEYQKHVHYAQRLLEDRARTLQAAQHAQVRHTHRTLQEKLPFWNDDHRRGAFLNELDSYLNESGFTPAERQSLADPRAIMVAREAMLFRQLMAQQAQIGSRRRQAPTSGRVLRPQASFDSSDGTGRAQALAKRAARTGRLDDQAEAILALLD